MSLTTVTFRELYALDFEVTELAAMGQRWIRGVEFRMDVPRRTNALIFLNGCVGQYRTAGGSVLDAPCKSILCLPAGSRYTVLNRECGLDGTDAYLIEFNIRRGEAMLSLGEQPFAVECDHHVIQDLIRQTVCAAESTLTSPLAVKAGVYQILNRLGQEAVQAHLQTFQPIDAAIRLLEEQALGTMTIGEMARVCGVCTDYFTRQFRAYAGKTPTQYRIDRRMSLARNMLESGALTVESIAESLGFENSSYFCKQFKKKVGMTPTAYRRRSSE